MLLILHNNTELRGGNAPGSETTGQVSKHPKIWNNYKTLGIITDIMYGYRGTT